MKSEIVPIRMEKDLKEKLQKMADKDSRTLSDYIRLMLTKITKGEMTEKKLLNK